MPLLPPQRCGNNRDYRECDTVNRIMTCVACGRTDYGVYGSDGVCVGCNRNRRACRERASELYAEQRNDVRSNRVRLRFDIALGVVSGIGVLRLLELLNSIL